MNMDIKQLLPGYDPSEEKRESEEIWLEVSLRLPSPDDDDPIWERAATDQDALFTERNEFLHMLEARGPASTPEQAAEDLVQFKKIMKRLLAGYKAHLERTYTKHNDAGRS